MWLDEEGGVWLDAEHACNVKVCIRPSQDQEKVPAPAPSAVYAPSSLLGTIPYFHACLSEPWQESAPSSSSQREISLECAGSTSPSDYRKCLLFLTPQEPVQMSLDASLCILRAADHLLYQECADVCMAYLASAPWSDKEEEIIHQAISSMGLKPSSDLAARLASEDDMKVFKEVLTRLAEKVGTGDKSVSTLRDFVRATFNEAPRPVASVCMSVIADAWMTATNNLIAGCVVSVAQWNDLTMLLLEYGDAEKLLEKFVGVSSKLCTAMFWVRDRVSLVEVLSQLFLRAVPGKSTRKVVLLSNSHRASLLAAWAPIVADIKCSTLESAYRQLFTTLPLQDPTVIAFLKEQASNPYFEACYKWWRTRLLKRMKRCDLVCEEIDLEASNSSTKRVRLTTAD